MVRLKVINLLLISLYLFIYYISSFGILTVNEFLLEFDLLVRDLILASLSAHKGLIHAVLVMQGWHLFGLRSIVMAKKLLHLPFPCL